LVKVSTVQTCGGWVVFFFEKLTR